MSDVPGVPVSHAAPWRRQRIADPRTRLINLRCTLRERAAIRDRATAAGLSVGAYLRRLALGDAGPRAVRRPPAAQAELAVLIGHLGKVGSNINQLAHAYNGRGAVPGSAELRAIHGEVAQMRAALLKALGHDHQG